MISDNYYVYVYVDPKTSEPIYVGKGKDSRYLHHIKTVLTDKPVKGYFYNLIRSRLNYGYKHPTINIFACNLNEDEAFCEEKRLIKRIGRKDKNQGPLLNLTDGGAGGAVSRNIMEPIWKSKEFSKNVSKSAKKYWDNISSEELQYRKDRIKDSYNDDLRAQRSISTKRSWETNRDVRKQSCQKARDKETENERQSRNSKISSSLKKNSYFVKNNPKSVEQKTIYGCFPSKNSLYCWYRDNIQNISRWKFDKYILEDIKEANTNER